MDRLGIAVELVTVWDGTRGGYNGGLLLTTSDIAQPAPTRGVRMKSGERLAAVERALASGKALRLAEVASLARLDHTDANSTLFVLRRRGRVIAEGPVRGMRYRLVAEGEA